MASRYAGRLFFIRLMFPRGPKSVETSTKVCDPVECAARFGYFETRRT